MSGFWWAVVIAWALGTAFGTAAYLLVLAAAGPGAWGWGVLIASVVSFITALVFSYQLGGDVYR